MDWEFRPYQARAIEFALDRISEGGGAALFLDPGLGKTLCTLQTISTLKLIGQLDRTLICAPPRVVHNVWRQQAELFGYDLKFEIVHGTVKQRSKAIQREADAYLVTPQGLRWLRETTHPEYGLFVYDESTAVKNWHAKQARAARHFAKRVDRRLILTGTPAPNSYADLHGQGYIVDRGESLGKTLSVFRGRFMRAGGYLGKEWVLNKDAQAAIDEAIAPWALRMSAEEYLDLPETITNDVWVELPPHARKVYDQLEKDFFATWDGREVMVGSASALYVKLKSLTGGAFYDTETGDVIHVHDEKVKAAQEIIDELQGKPAIVAYQYTQERDRLQHVFPRAPAICGGAKEADTQKVISDWNEKRHPVVLVQPQSLSHGVNMQAGGNDLIWFGLTNHPEAYQQLNARLHRQGVVGSVRYHRILARNTVDEAVAAGLDTKAANQQALFDSLTAYRKRRYGS